MHALTGQRFNDQVVHRMQLRCCLLQRTGIYYSSLCNSPITETQFLLSMSSPLIWRNVGRAKGMWVTRQCTSLVGTSTMSCLPVQIGTACRYKLRNISSGPSLCELSRDNRASPTIAITLELKGARQFLEALAPRSESPVSPASTGCKVSVDATAPTHGAVTPHAANAPQTDVAALKAAMEECTQQAQNLLAFAKKTGWAAEDLGNMPVHLKKEKAANARDGISLPNNEAYMSALQVQTIQPVADTSTEDAQSQVHIAEHMRLTSSHANLRLEHSNTLARLQSLESAFESAEAQRSAAVAELEDLRSQLSGLEALQSDHQELKDEHIALADNYEQITEQYGQQWHEVLALQGERRLQLSEAEEVRAQNLAEVEDLKQKHGTDLDRLQAEVLSLQDQLDSVSADLELKTEQDKHLRQQFGGCLEQFSKAIGQLSACNSKFEAERQEQQAAREQLVTDNVELQQKLALSEDNASTLQQGRINCSNLTRALDRLKASELRCCELEQDLDQSRASSSDTQSKLATLQADLKKLHDLTAGGCLTAENLFHMFAKPASSEDSGHRWEEPVPPPATANTAAATAASYSSDTEQTSCDGDFLFRDDTKERTTDSQTAGASGRTAFSEATSEASAHTFVSTADIAANSSRRHDQCGTGHDQATGAGTQGTRPAGAEQEDEGLDDGGIMGPTEDVSNDERAAQLQQDLAMQYKCRYLSHTSALYAGAKAYASSAPQYSFSTEEVILSMLQHDSTFLQLLAMKSREAGIDQFILESAVAGIHRYVVEQEESAWLFNSRRPAFICSSAPQALRWLNGETQEERMPDITMVVPSNFGKVDQLALQSLYQYWGVPCAPDMYRS